LSKQFNSKNVLNLTQIYYLLSAYVNIDFTLKAIQLQKRVD